MLIEYHNTDGYSSSILTRTPEEADAWRKENSKSELCPYDENGHYKPGRNPRDNKSYGYGAECYASAHKEIYGW